MGKMLAFFYGVICYLIFLTTFLYAVGFVGNLIVPKTIDSIPTASLGEALLINILLLTVFALQHSVMARQGFKKAWTQVIPKPVERSTYVLFSSLALILLFWKWEPMGGVVWELTSESGRLLLHGL